MNLRTLDPIGLCFLERLVEADEARKTSFRAELTALHPSSPTDIACCRWEHNMRKQEWLIEAFQFVTHMIFLDETDEDLQAYKRLWQESLCISRDLRDASKFQQSVIAIAERAISEYRTEISNRSDRP